ncbi:cyclic beta-1,2-glucan ABC transporter [Aureimonas ureilytica]|uniref:Cyclic beta-1,2-glucan ABC transporter n=1 Tax=Aureimonas ureilytica TaxID=401562 RepID=A0A175RN49_9HYPH|nr:glucan ABC transporter ATP-binding protein/ permease [Aureimonas ureilytica]KTR05067.1 cyclic beta-1,2-glucan ABC transporter [Aureimonas ureilytica]
MSALSKTLSAYAQALTLLAPERGKAIGIVLAGMAVAGIQVAEPVLFGHAINALLSGGNALSLVLVWGAASFVSFLSAMVISLLADRLMHRRRLSAMATFLEHVLALPASFHSRSQSGRLMRVMISGVDTLFGFWLPLFREQIGNMVALTILLPVAFWMNWRLASLLGVLIVVYTLVNLAVVKRTSGGQNEVEGHFTEVSGTVGELFGNVSMLQSFLAVPRELHSVRSSLDRILAAQYPVLNWWAVMSVLTRGASSISIVSIFAYGAFLASRGQASVGEIVSFVGFATLLIGRLDQFTGFLMGLFGRAPMLVQFFAVLRERTDVVEFTDAQPLAITEGRVRFENVTFRYPEGSGAVRGISFEAAPGETVAIVGPTGSGKSTALALLQRAYDPEQGRITIDGQDIRNVTLTSLRGSIGVVFQEAGLFSRTIQENIAIGRPEATMAEIEEAAKLAGALDFIQRKDDGFASMVGERGAGLSGGERQRLAIARALLKDAPILILDEATSALDTATETRLQAALERLRAGRTTFVIAHRLSTIRSADKIIVLDGGQIIETGTFDDLVAQGGVFAGLARDAGVSSLRRPLPETAQDNEAETTFREAAE